jgi:hydrogenase maturation protein HypF
MTTERLRIAVEGVVQGVGFRPFVYGLAGRLGVRGFVANRAGDVVIEAEGDRTTLDRFVAELSNGAPAAARVDRVVTTAAAVRGEPGFQIENSELAAGTAAAIAPDLATCDACVEEIFDPASRRYRYAFTSCAACGPRLTIVTAAPYDRARTTMAPFPMCTACRAEFDEPTDRRFHAQPIACPACGPTLAMDGASGDPLAAAAAAIRAGRIIAIKGLGGFHLACDATNEATVEELRVRKQRDAKPFAVMVGSVEAAAALGHIDDASRTLLTSAARPIVLVPKQQDSALAPSVSPGVADVGVMLPYTPLHHVLVRDLGIPLVMTSGNVSDEPIVFADDDARERLAEIADSMLVHDRAIHMRCEDSVARVVDGAPMILRRARGYAPAPIRFPLPIARPTLALGGHLKASFVYGTGNLAFASPHLGDLDELSAYEAFVTALSHFKGLHRIVPELIVCDMHPDYATTRLAEQMGLPTMSVQHHHAHFASAFADAGLHGPAIGVIFDGAGYGADGTIWGGEILVGEPANVWRAAHIQYVGLPGGDRAAIEPWRMAVSHLAAAGEPYADFAPDAERVAATLGRAMRTSSMGRLFDAVAALIGIATHSVFEGQAAMQLEALARTAGPEAAYPFELAADELVVAPMIRAISRDVRMHVAPARIARRFHTTVVELAANACAQIARGEGLRDVVLSGGVFQNAILGNELPARLRALGLVPHVQRRVPPNDGGLAFGQLAVAAARGAT